MTGSHDLSLLHGLDSHCHEDPGPMPEALYPVYDQKSYHSYWQGTKGDWITWVA